MATRIYRPNGQFIELDAATSISLELPSTATSFPVEDGSKISDHITPDSRQLSIEGIVSDATNTLKASVQDNSVKNIVPKILRPFIDLGVLTQFLDNKASYSITTTPLPPEQFGKPQLAMEFFQTIRSNRELVRVVEGDGSEHTNLAVVAVRRLRDAETGVRGISLSISFQEIRIVTSRTTTIKQQRKPAASIDKKQAGDTTNSNVKTDADNESSYAKAIVKKVSG
jgi:hypothetical protein